ncbi:SRPK2 bound unphosphorylated [Fusarium pseudocircinatum]|uniref:non-specific serine/threonine protein kinase n=1 Tax=Fusarium pseudocircinatum TaxID=56676 RepID=A0A8H5NY11_9HYPO|nr:SRPK2 bound unphosphorylated [Fusarium pseudocircinatum]
MLRLSFVSLTRRVSPARFRLFDTQFSATHRPCSNASHRAMSTPSVRYKYLEEVEVLEDYRPGGYHPVQINDTLHHDRYQIVHKLGHGTFSTAWLALDRNSSTYVAVKVGTSDADKGEVGILSKLAMADTDETMIPQVLDSFIVKGPNGSHPCLVTTPARCSLIDTKDASDSGLFQLDVARSLAVQVIKAVAHVHSRGYAHGASLNNLSIDQLYAKFGAPTLEPIVRLDGSVEPLPTDVPSHAVLPVWLGLPSDDISLCDAKLLLSDFGVAFRPADKTKCESNAPLVVRPPEPYFEPTMPLTFESDIWSPSCLIFELFAHRSLIDGIIACQDDITAQQVHLQGIPPPEWWDKWDKRSKWFDNKGQALSNERDIWSWDRRFKQWIQEPRKSEGMETLNSEEAAALLDLLRRMLAWKHENRPQAQQVLESGWVKDWALPAYNKTKRTSEVVRA